MKLPAWIKDLFVFVEKTLADRKRQVALAKRDRWYRRRCTLRVRTMRIGGWLVKNLTAVRPARPDPGPLARAWRLDRIEAKRQLVREAKAQGRMLRRSLRKFAEAGR